MNPAKKRQQMVLAQTIKGDPLTNTIFLIIVFKDSAIDKGRNIHLVAFQQSLYIRATRSGVRFSPSRFRISPNVTAGRALVTPDPPQFQPSAGYVYLRTENWYWNLRWNLQVA